MGYRSHHRFFDRVGLDTSIIFIACFILKAYFSYRLENRNFENMSLQKILEEEGFFEDKRKVKKQDFS